MSTMIGPAELEIVAKLLEDRCRKIDVLAAELKRSERSVRYSLGKLNEFFRKQHGENLVAMEGQQQLELLPSTDAIVKAMGKISKNHYYMSMEERVELTSFQYLAGFNFTIDELADFMNISVSTLKQSMPMVRQRLEEYNISLVNVHRIGLKAVGKEKDIRKALANQIYRNFDLICHPTGKRVLSCFKTNPYFRILLRLFLANIPADQLLEIVDAYNAEYKIFQNDEYYKLVLAEMAVLYQRCLMGRFLEKDLEFDAVDKDKALFLKTEFICRFNMDLPIQEFSDLIRVMDDTSAANVVPLNILLTEMLNKLIETHLKGKSWDLSHPRIVEAIGILNRHFQYAVSRIRKGISVENPLLAEIKKSHEKLFKDIKAQLKGIEQYAGRAFSESEVGYFTILIENIFSIIVAENKKIKNIIVVCGIGYGASQLLTNKIKQYFRVNVVDVIPYHKLGHVPDADIDLIVTTIPLREKVTDIAVVQVSPLMSDADMEKLKAAGLMRERLFPPDLMLTVIRKYCTVRDEEGLINELNLLFSGEPAAPEKGKYVRLLSLLKDNILLKKEVSSWQDAIKAAGSLLVRKGSVDETYVADTIANIETFGPYMAVDSVLLPHAKNRGNVFRTDFSLVTLTKPVKLTDGRLINTVFCFCSVDGLEHVDVLISFMDLVENNGLLAEIEQFEQVEDLLNFIRSKG